MIKLGILLLGILLFVPLISAGGIMNTTHVNMQTQKTINETPPMSISQIKEKNPWNETVIISPVWQTLIGGFFGLNLYGESTKITIREAIIFFSIFIMVFTIIFDILKIIPIFDKKIFGFIPSGLVSSLIITTLASITGTFINLKNLFINSVIYLSQKFNWVWMENSINNFWGTVFLSFSVIIIIFIITELLGWLGPVIKKYSKLSRAEAKGRMLRAIIRNNEDR